MNIFRETLEQQLAGKNKHIRQLFTKINKKKNTLKLYWKPKILKEADRGSTVVILDKTYYKLKIQEILNYETILKAIDASIDKNMKSKTTKLCTAHKEIQKRKGHYNNFNPRSSNLSKQPKVHKSKEIKTVIKHKNQNIRKSLTPVTSNLYL